MTEEATRKPESRPRRAPSWRAAARLTLLAVGLGVFAVVQGDQVAELVTGRERPVLIQALVTGVLIGGVFALVSMGLTLIFGVLHIINFAQGAFITLGMYVTYVIVEATGIDPYLTLPATVACLFVVGAITQRFVLNPVMRKPIEAGLLVTLGLAIVIENALRLGFGSTPRSVQLGYGFEPLDLGFTQIELPLRVFGAVVQLPQLIAFVAAIALGALLFLLLHRTRAGTAIRSVSANPVGASLVGIDVSRIYMLTFGIGCACAGAAGVLILPFQSLDPTTGTSFGIIAFVVVVLGGLGSVPGALVGGLLVGLTQEVGAALFPDQSKLLPVFLVFLFTLFVRPQGLLSRGSG